MTIQANPQDGSLRYIPWRQITRADIDNLTGIAQQYAKDMVEIIEDSGRIIASNNIINKNHLIEKNNELINISKNLIDRNWVNTYLKVCLIAMIVVLAVYTFFIIAHDAKWFRVFKSW